MTDTTDQGEPQEQEQAPEGGVKSNFVTPKENQGTENTPTEPPAPAEEPQQ